MVYKRTGLVTRGNVCEAQRELYVCFIRTHHYTATIYLRYIYEVFGMLVILVFSAHLITLSDYDSICLLTYN